MSQESIYWILLKKLFPNHHVCIQFGSSFGIVGIQDVIRRISRQVIVAKHYYFTYCKFLSTLKLLSFDENPGMGIMLWSISAIIWRKG